MTEIRTAEQYVVAQKIRPRVAEIVQDLRALADTVEMLVGRLDRVGQPERSSYTSTYASVASAITQQVANALPALQLGPLAQYAAEADVARAKGE